MTSGNNEEANLLSTYKTYAHTKGLQRVERDISGMKWVNQGKFDKMQSLDITVQSIIVVLIPFYLQF